MQTGGIDLSGIWSGLLEQIYQTQDLDRHHLSFPAFLKIRIGLKGSCINSDTIKVTEVASSLCLVKALSLTFTFMLRTSCLVTKCCLETVCETSFPLTLFPTSSRTSTQSTVEHYSCMSTIYMFIYICI